MKITRLLLILSVVLTGNLSFAQGLELELLIKPTLTSLRGDDGVENMFDPTPNFSTGIGANYFLTPKSFINFGILYDRKGGRGDAPIEYRDGQNQVIGYGTVTRELNFDYLVVPVQFGQRFGQRVKIEYGVGVYTGFLLKGELITKTSTYNSEQENEYLKKIDFGLSANFNVYVPIKDSFSLKFGLNDNVGLIDVSDDGLTMKHNSLGLVVGLNFKIK